MILFVTPTWVAFLFCALLGISFATIGFNVMHDSAHGSFSSKKWLNSIAGYSLNLMGGNVFIWKSKHNVNHHTYTNVEGMDDDIDIQPWIRTHVDQKRRWFHRYQYIYCFFLYGLTYLNWIFIGDFKKYLTGKLGKTKLSTMNLKEHCVFWMSKLLFCTLFLIVPILKFGLLKTLVGFVIMAFVCGIILGLVFQLAHLTTEASFPMPSKESNQMETNWVRHQISTTVNFAPKSKWIFWFTGGLNFQLVHHIFPKISHIHYPAMNILIRETCEKFKVKYTEYQTFGEALRSHVSYLKQLGTC